MCVGFAIALSCDRIAGRQGNAGLLLAVRKTPEGLIYTRSNLIKLIIVTLMTRGVKSPDIAEWNPERVALVGSWPTSRHEFQYSEPVSNDCFNLFHYFGCGLRFQRK